MICPPRRRSRRQRDPHAEGDDQRRGVLLDQQAGRHRDPEQPPAGSHRCEDGQRHSEHEEGLGVELLEVALLQGRVAEVGGGEQGGDERAEEQLQTEGIDDQGGGAEQDRLQDEQGLGGVVNPVQRDGEQQDEGGVVPEQVPAHHGHKRGVEPAEQPHALIEDPHVKPEGPVTVLHGDAQPGEIPGVGGGEQHDGGMRGQSPGGPGRRARGAGGRRGDGQVQGPIWR